MNIFKKIKNSFSRMTDSGVKITLELNSMDLNAPINILITAETGKKSVHIDKIFLLIKSEEKITIPKKNLPSRLQRKIKQESLEISTAQFSEREFIVSEEAQKLESEQTYTWSAEIKIDEKELSSYNGTFAKHQWMLTAGLDSGKKDIRSEWEIFHLR